MKTIFFLLFLFIFGSCAAGKINKNFAALQVKELTKVIEILGVPSKTLDIEGQTFSTWRYRDCEITTTSRKKDFIIDNVNWNYDKFGTFCDHFYNKIESSNLK